MPKVYYRPAARRDIAAHFAYLAKNADSETADRFFDAARATFSELAAQPHIGAPWRLRPPELAGLRKWRVRDFENVLIFYLSRVDGITLVRVLHASQDWWGLLGMI